jgi:SSS family solute:Na+ symporter
MKVIITENYEEMSRVAADILIGIVIVLVLSASMSTLSSLVLTSSSTLTLDVIKGILVKKMTEKKTTSLHACIAGVFYCDFRSNRT